MPVVPSLAELEATIARMEKRYAADPMFADYQRLKLRFAADLADERDVALSQAAALMLIKYWQEDEK